MKDQTKNLLHVIGYLKGLEKVPLEWEQAPLHVKTPSGILDTISKYGFKPATPKPSIEYYDQDIENDIIKMLNRKKGLAKHRWGILLVDWPDIKGYGIALERDKVSGKLALFDPTLGKLLSDMQKLSVVYCI